MGVRGLTTYINHNQHVFLKYHLLHDSNLVIDGHSLCAQLYRSLNCFSAFGGDYDKFALCCRNFFKSLKKCNITPFLIFDGSYENKKLKTAYSRLRSKINGASRLDPVTQDSLQIFPLLLRDVFKEVLTDLMVPFTVCEFEADDEIAALARHLSCPVLSYDSDFFIYNVLYIPFNTLELKPVPVDEDGNRFFALECKLYKAQYLCDHFGGLKEDMLPLLATLLGNDYVEKRVFSKFFSQLKLHKSKVKKNEQQRSIHTLFKWLQNETLESAISKILGRLKKNQKDRVFFIIKKCIDGYNKKSCRSLKYFGISDDDMPVTVESNLCMPEDKSEPSSDDEQDDSCDESDDSSTKSSNDEEPGSEEDIDTNNQLVLGLPFWFADGIRLNRIPQSYINLYTHHLHFCSPQAEDYKDEDSFLPSLPLLRYAFDILTDFSQEHCIYVSRENDSNYKRIFVGKEYSIPRPLDEPLWEVTEEEAKSFFKHFLTEKLPLLDINVIDLLPSNFQLYMITIIWWVKNCNVTLAHLHSLFICYVMLEVVDEKTGTFRGCYHLNNKHSKKLEEIRQKEATLCSVEESELYLNKNKVQYEDALLAASVLLKHFEIDDSIRKKPKSYDAKRMHSFAQFQCCLQQFNCLNTLCYNPFERTKYSKCYNGTFAYNVALKLEKQENPVSFIEQYLKGATTVLMFYKSICILYEKLAMAMSLTTIKCTGKKRRKKKNTEKDDIYFIMKGFESEVVI